MLLLLLIILGLVSAIAAILYFRQQHTITKDTITTERPHSTPLLTTFNSSRTYDLKRHWKGEDMIPQNNKGWAYFRSPTWIAYPPQDTATWSNSEPTSSMVNYTDGQLGGNFEGSDEDELVIKVLASDSGINAVRLHSVEQFEQGLFVMKVSQIPHGTYVWPSWWLLGDTSRPNAWAMNGEIDIIEGGWFEGGPSKNVKNTSTLHTQTDCVKSGKRCNATGSGSCGEGGKHACPYDGCGFEFSSEKSFGSGFPGGYFCLEMKQNGVLRIWMFHEGKEPSNLSDDSVDTTSWPTSNASDGSVEYVDLSSSPCPSTFASMHMIINTAVGGAAFVDAPGRQKKPTFKEAVASIQQHSSESEWRISWIKVFQ